MRTRRDIVLGLGAIMMADGAARAAPGGDVIAPDQAGFTTGVDASFDALHAAGKLAGVHGVVAVRHGRIVFERYMAGEDMAWGRSLGRVEFGPGTLHDMRSVSKSLIGLLYGIALEAGQVPAPDQPLVAQFPEYPDLVADPARAPLQVVHALTMTLGLAWDEQVPYSDPANSEIAMEASPDRFRYVLERPVVGEPGQGWIYCGGATALLGRLIEKGTGQELASYAQSVLFDPLGISDVAWARGQDGRVIAASGCRLTPRDLTRIGRMAMARGVWDGRQVVPAAWLEASVQPRATVNSGIHYGYHWYLSEWAVPGPAGIRGERWVAAFGNGGQRLFIVPGLDFVLAVTAGSYDKPDQWRAPMTIMREVFLANLAR